VKPKDKSSAAFEDESWDAGWDSPKRHQLNAWLAKTPAERLAWLEKAIEFATRYSRSHNRVDPDA
jgi:hypothetical protein